MASRRAAVYSIYMSSGDTGIRSVTAKVIVDQQGSLLLRQTPEGYEFTGLFERASVKCKTWSETERVLIRMKVPPHKIQEIVTILGTGSDVVLRRDEPQ